MRIDCNTTHSLKLKEATPAERGELATLSAGVMLGGSILEGQMSFGLAQLEEATGAANDFLLRLKALKPAVNAAIAKSIRDSR